MNATTQEIYASMLREHIAPALRELGFKGSGRTFIFPSETCWASIGFQKSQWSDSSKLTFTANMTVASREAWEEARKTWTFLGERPAANTSYAAPRLAVEGYWFRRVSGPDGGEQWWTLDRNTDPRSLGDEVVAAIRAEVIPAMRERIAELT